MSLTADLGEARLSVLLDVRHPLAYLALRPALAFGESLGIGINWLPLSVPTLRPPTEPGPDDDRGQRHRRNRARAIAREIVTYADAQGLVLREYYRDGAADAANVAWLWARDRHREVLPVYLMELFRRYWALEIDASSTKEIALLLDAVGADGTSFLDWCDDEGASAAGGLADELQDAGLFQTPVYVVEDEVFYGRQHLPMIRWILEGRSGPGPI